MDTGTRNISLISGRKRLGLFNKITGLKFFNVYGPNEYYKGDMSSVVWKAFNKIRETGSFSLFRSHRPDYKDGEQMRDFVYVKDCCDVMWWLLNTPSVTGLFNLGTGKARTWNDLVNSVFAALGSPANIQYVDMPSKLIKHYQYFTEAPMQRLLAAGYPGRIHQLEEGIEGLRKESSCTTRYALLIVALRVIEWVKLVFPDVIYRWKQ